MSLWWPKRRGNARGWSFYTIGIPWQLVFLLIFFIALLIVTVISALGL